MTAPVLSKDIRTRQLIAMAAGGMIGAGWMVVIGSWIQTAGTLGSALAFLAGLLMVLPVALCYARLAARFPQSGGEIVYVYEAFGTLPAFAVGWLYLFICLGWSAFQIVAASWFVTILLPWFPNAVMYTVLNYDVSAGFLIIAVTGTVYITRVNYRGGGTSAQLQEYLTAVLAVGIIGIVITSFSTGSVASFKAIWSEHSMTGSGFLALLITVPVWYSGFNVMAQALGEVGGLKVQHISRIIIGTLVGTSLFYVSVIVAISYAVTPQSLATASPALLGMFEPDSNWGPRIVILIGLLGIITTWNVLFFAATRILFALSRTHIIPKPFSTVHPRYGAPGLAVLFVGLFTLAGSLTGRGLLELVVNTSGICFAVIYLFVALTYLRLASSFASLSGQSGKTGLWIGRIAATSAACMVLFALLVTFRSRDFFVPLEWCALIAWIVLGAVVWQRGRALRNLVSEAQRRDLIHAR